MNPDFNNQKSLSYSEGPSSNSSISETMFLQQNVSVTAVTASSILPLGVAAMPPAIACLPPRKLPVQAEEQKTQTAKNYLGPELTRPIS